MQGSTLPVALVVQKLRMKANTSAADVGFWLRWPPTLLSTLALLLLAWSPLLFLRRTTNTSLLVSAFHKGSRPIASWKSSVKSPC